MNNQPPQQRFCTNCGQQLSPGVTFCGECGTPVDASTMNNAPGQYPAGMQMNPQTMNAPGQVPPGGQSGSPPLYAQVPAQGNDDSGLADLAAVYIASRRGRQGGQPVRRRERRRGGRLLGCGCLLLILAIVAGSFSGVALTSGKLHLIFVYAAVGMIFLFFLFLVIVMLVTREGRESLAEGCLDAILGGFLGGN